MDKANMSTGTNQHTMKQILATKKKKREQERKNETH